MVLSMPSSSARPGRTTKIRRSFGSRQRRRADPASGLVTKGHRKDPNRFAFVRIEHVPSEIELLVREAQKQPPLNVTIARIRARALGDGAKSKPIEGRNSQFR